MSERMPAAPTCARAHPRDTPLDTTSSPRGLEGLSRMARTPPSHAITTLAKTRFLAKFP